MWRKPVISSSLQTLNHQFLQKCSVSGTAKGKGKLKTSGPLIKQKITRKGAKPRSTGGGGKANDRLDKMVDACWNAPTPVRYLSAKDRAREAEREKLGLISKDRQRELDSFKEKKNAKPEPTPTPLMGPPGYDLITLGLVDKDKIPKYELTVEDGRKLAKEYSRVLMRKHRARQAAESNLLKCKKEAIEALPDHLKAAALVPDLTPFPMNRFMATLTPPIEGYIDKINEAAKKNMGKAKLR